MEKLNSTLHKYSPDSTRLVESNFDSTNLSITKDMNIQDIPIKQLPLVHTKLHMFYADNNGKGLTPKNIIDIHNKLTKIMNNHTVFDKLDYEGV